MQNEISPANCKALYRAVNNKEYDLIEESGFKKFPPRLSWQPIFYPVCNEEYAIEIAKWDFNTFDIRHILKFYVHEDFMKDYDVKVVGSKIHSEYWIPADKLEDFNDALAVPIIELYRIVKNYGGGVAFVKNGKVHRENGPAIEQSNGDKFWYINGKLHREGGPASEYQNGYKEWWINGKRHREDGPAIIYSNGNKFWYVEGTRYSEEDFNNLSILKIL